MQKKDIKQIKKNTYFYKNNLGSSLYLDISFVYDTTRINDLKASILERYLCTINSVYKTRIEISDKKRSLYNPVFSIHDVNYSNKSIMYFTYRMLDPKVVKDDYYNDAIDFIYDMFFKPYFKNNKLDGDRFNTIKKDIYNEYINMVKDLHYDSDVKYKTNVLKELSSNKLLYETKEELEKDLNSITDKDIIDFYYMIINNHYKTLLFGDYSKDQINYLLKKFSFNNKDNYKIDRKERFNLKKEYNEYISKEYSQSILYFTYKIKNDKKYSNVYYSDIIQIMLNNTNGLLLKLLREKYGLVYSAFAYVFYRDTNVFCIEANIDKKNKDKTINAVNELFSQLHDKNIVEDRLNYSKDIIKESVYLSNENPYNVFNKYVSIIYKKDLTDTGYLRKVNKITTKDILDFFDNLENENIFFYVGDKDE